MLVHVRPTLAAANATSASVNGPMPLSAHCSPRDAHTVAQLWPTTAPRDHCGAAVAVAVAVADAVADAEAPCDRLDVGVVLAVLVAVGVQDAVLVLVPVAVSDALAPRVRLPVGEYDACGQKHMRSQLLISGTASWHDGRPRL